jgi:integrase
MGLGKRVRIPSYRHHRPSGQAVVTISGRDVYLGRWGSPESKAEYERLIEEWLASGRQDVRGNAITVAELILAYWKHAKQHYRKNGQPTSEQHIIRQALRPVRKLYGHTLARDFGPIAFKTCREAILEAGRSRSTVNSYANRVKRMFRWGVENELVRAEVYQALQAVSGLRRGRSAAHETGPVEPVSDEHVQAILSHLSYPVQAMVKLQLLTGMRPGEVVKMRARDLRTSGDIWTYEPEGHKTEHLGKVRCVSIGPRSQAAIRPFLRADLQGYLFSPRDQGKRGVSRENSSVEAELDTKLRINPGRKLGLAYTVASYRRAITRACDQAGIPRWRPNQLRHTAATRFRREFGIEVTRALLGHSSTATSEIYAEIDLNKAQRAMATMG